MKEIMNFKIKLPSTLVGKEEFTLGEVFSIDENRIAFEEAIEKDVKSASKLKEKEIKDNLKLEYNEKFEEYKKNVDKSKNEEIKIKVEAEKNLLKSEKEKVKYLKESNEDIKKSLDMVEKVYQEKLKEEMRAADKKHATEIANLKKQTSNEIGELGEEEVINKITEILPNDKVSKPSAQAGEADVLVEMNSGETIYIEVKNRKNWSKANYENFAQKIRKRSDSGALFISKALPKNSKEFITINEGFLYHPTDDIYLTSFASFAPAVYTIRQLTSKYGRMLKEANASQETQKKLFDFIGSSEYENYFSTYKKHIEDLEKVFKAIQKETSKGLGKVSELDIGIENLYEVTNSKKIEE